MAVRKRRAKKSGKAKAPFFEAWSYSRWKKYADCPAAANYQFLLKVEVPDEKPGAAMIRGGRIHEEAEGYLNTPKSKLPVSLELFSEEFKLLRRIKASPESGFQFDNEWKPLPGWFDEDVWARVKTDAEYTEGKGKKRVFVVIDYKTGRQRRWHEDQLELYGLAALIARPDIENVRGELWYLDTGDIVELDFSQDQREALQAKWTKKVEKMMADRIFKPTPSRTSCQWCNFKKAKGGPCEF